MLLIPCSNTKLVTRALEGRVLFQRLRADWNTHEAQCQSDVCVISNSPTISAVPLPLCPAFRDGQMLVRHDTVTLGHGTMLSFNLQPPQALSDRALRSFGQSWTTSLGSQLYVGMHRARIYLFNFFWREIWKGKSRKTQNGGCTDVTVGTCLVRNLLQLRSHLIKPVWELCNLPREAR